MQISTKSGTKHYYVKRNQFLTKERPHHSFPRGDDSETTLTRVNVKKVKKSLLQNHWANINKTWHKVFLVEGDSSLFK